MCNSSFTLVTAILSVNAYNTRHTDTYLEYDDGLLAVGPLHRLVYHAAGVGLEHGAGHVLQGLHRLVGQVTHLLVGQVGVVQHALALAHLKVVIDQLVARQASTHDLVQIQ